MSYAIFRNRCPDDLTLWLRFDPSKSYQQGGFGGLVAFLEEHEFGVTSITHEASVGDMAHVTLEMLVMGRADPSKMGKRAEAFGIEAAPEDSQDAVQALYDLEDACPPDKMVVADICPNGEDGPRFMARLVDRPT